MTLVFRNMTRYSSRYLAIRHYTTRQILINSSHFHSPSPYQYPRNTPQQQRLEFNWINPIRFLTSDASIKNEEHSFPHDLTPAELIKLLENNQVTLVDVREPNEVVEYFLKAPNVQYLPLSQVKEAAAQSEDALKQVLSRLQVNPNPSSSSEPFT